MSSTFRIEASLVSLAELRAVVAERETGLVGFVEREALEAEEEGLRVEAQEWVAKYNRSVGARLAGYVALGKRCDFAYPWPVVAVLGIQQVLEGMHRNRLLGLMGRLRGAWAKLADASEDVLRRTNRGIFADSVPTVLRALRAVELRREGRGVVADGLLDGLAAGFFDEESRALARAIADGLGVKEEKERFAVLAAVTVQHFAREQAIFTFHMGAPGKRPPPKIVSVPAPVIERGKLVVRPYELPAGFDIREHAERVRSFGRAFVSSVTGSLEDYRVAKAWVVERY